MHYKSKITPAKDGATFSLAIRFTQEELNKAYPYFSVSGVQGVELTPNVLKFIKDIGEDSGIHAELSFLRNLVFEAEYGPSHTGKIVSGRSKKKRKKRRRKIK